MSSARPASPTSHRHRPGGHTLLEALIVIALVAVLLKTVLPGWTEHQARRRVEAASAQMLADLELLRASALARDEGLRMTFRSAATGSCYLMHSGDAGLCSCPADGNGRPMPACAIGARLLQARSWSRDELVLQANVNSLWVEPRLGNISPSGSIDLSAGGLPALRHVVNLLGRVRLCSASPDPTTSRWPGVSPC